MPTKNFRVYVSTDEIPDEALNVLQTVAEVRVNPNEGPPSRETLLNEVREADGLFCLLTEKIDEELMSQAKKLRVVANMAVGFDNIDLRAATEHGILASNTPGVLTETVADATMALLLAIARRVVEADRWVRNGNWVIRWSPMMMVGADVYGKTLGIYGLGRIGASVAKRAKGFDMKLIYYDAVRNKELEEKHGIEYVPMERLLRESDFISVHVPLLPETRKSLGAAQFAMMKKSAFLINTARGQVIDEQALIEALREKKIAGVALDVFENEPIEKDSPLLKMENVIAVPHIASGSLETRVAMGVLAANNIVAALKNEVPPTLLNPDALKKRRPTKE
jgi:glyoxylate reductase